LHRVNSPSEKRNFLARSPEASGPLRQFVVPEDASRLQQYLARARRTHRSFTAELTLRGGDAGDHEKEKPESIHNCISRCTG
jgi:hypothetical protein